MKKAPPVATLDFETEEIKSRPVYPPVPVGFSIKRVKDKKSRYYAWGHPTKNNCTLAQAKKVLKDLWDSEEMILCHHAKFDIDVAQTHMGVGELPWDRIHDTQYILFLENPHAPSLGLKPSGERVLGIKPEERDVVRDWILANIPEAKKKPSTWGAYICKAPGDIVGTYADGDVYRTEKLFKKLYPFIVAEGMLPAYDRERQLMPIFLANERQGLRVDVTGLERDIPLYRKEFETIEAWLRKRLKAPADFNFDSDADVAKILGDRGIVTEWVLTKTGKNSTAKKNMTVDKFTDKKVFLALGYRNRLATCLRMFMEPWLLQAKASGGAILPTWNQVRQPKGDGGSKGTRTGRPSCEDPNLLNLSKDFEDRGDDYTHPTFIKGLLPLPLVRQYILPDKGCVWLHRDYNQQELRILAHFEDGAIKEAYDADPTMDIHTFVQKEVQRITGVLYDRSSIKQMNFGKIYGMGLGALAIKLKAPVEEVKGIRDAQNKSLPGLPLLEKELKRMGGAEEPIVTWGGRVYYCEPPKFVEKFNREITFEYKLLNYLIQGSAADATKEAIIRFCNHPKRKAAWRFLVTVYDEINICAPPKEKEAAMALLGECMEGLAFDVPLLSDGKVGPAWGRLEKYKEPKQTKKVA